MEEKLFEFMAASQQKQEIEKVVACNQKTEAFGLMLTNEDAQMLMECRKENLKEQERVEFGEGILPKLIYAFCDSQYISQDNYVETVSAL